MAVILTAGAIPILSNGGWQKKDVNPVVQVTNIRNVGVSKYINNESYELTLSDGSFYHHASLSSLYNPLVRSQQLQKSSIIQLTRFDCNPCTFRPISITELNVILVNYSNIIGDPKPFPSPMQGQILQQTMLTQMQLRRTGMLSTMNESATRRTRRVYNPKINTVNEKGYPNSKKLKTSESSSEDSQSSSEEGEYASASINDHGKTAIELIDLEQDIKKPLANLIENKRGPTIDECVDKLKGVGLEATDPLYLAAFCIFSQRDKSRESWMKLPSEPEVLKGWITMMAKMKGIMK